MCTKITWEQGNPCELPEEFDPFVIHVWGGKDFLTLGKLNRPTWYMDDETQNIIKWLAQEYLRFALLEQNQDLSEATIRQQINTGNWFLKHLEKQKLEFDTIDDYKFLTKIFQKIAAKTRSDVRNRSNETKQGNRTPIIHLRIVNRFLAYIYPNDASFISDHLHHGKQFDSIVEPPSEFCVIETVRFVANLVESKEIILREAISDLKEKSSITEPDVLFFFKTAKEYRNLFLYLFISITGMNGTNAMLITLEDLSIGNDKKTTGKAVSVYKARASKVVSFEISKDFLTKYVIPFVSIFNNYNLLCEKFTINLKLDYIGRQIFREDEEYRHISQYYLFSSWLKLFKSQVIRHLSFRLKEEEMIDHIIKVPTPSRLLILSPPQAALIR